MSDVSINTEMTAEPESEDFKKKDLIAAVAERTGRKKSDVKAIAEGVLAVLGDSLADGKTLNLQPLGKVQVLNSSHQPNAHVIRCKVRRAKPDADQG